MRVRVADAAGVSGIALMLLGGGVSNVLDLAGMYLWAARLLIVVGIVFCGVYQTRKGLLREQGSVMPSGPVPEGDLVDLKKG